MSAPGGALAHPGVAESLGKFIHTRRFFSTISGQDFQVVSMVLFIIGLGLGNEKDITLRALEAVKKCDFVFLQYYTSILGAKLPEIVRT